MPTINLPLVKFDRDAGGFACPRCKAIFVVHSEFTEHFAVEHTPRMTPPQRGPVASVVPPPATPLSAGPRTAAGLTAELFKSEVK